MRQARQKGELTPVPELPSQAQLHVLLGCPPGAVASPVSRDNSSTALLSCSRGKPTTGAERRELPDAPQLAKCGPSSPCSDATTHTHTHAQARPTPQRARTWKRAGRARRQGHCPGFRECPVPRTGRPTGPEGGSVAARGCGPGDQSDRSRHQVSLWGDEDALGTLEMLAQHCGAT